MNHTWNREERRRQKALLKDLYDDYDPKRHEVFVERFNKTLDEERTREYLRNRGFTD